MLSQLSEITGMPIFEIRVFVVIIVHLLFGFAYRSLSNQGKNQIGLRHFYGFAIGQITYLFLYSFWNCLLFSAYSAGFYFIALRAKSPKSYLAIVFVSFSLLSIIHLHRLVDPTVTAESDLTYILMILIPKKIYFVSHIFSLHSGLSEPVPSFTEYMGYLYNFLGNTVLPIYSYGEYRAFILHNYVNPVNKNTLFGRNALIFVLTLLGTFGGGIFFNIDFLLRDEFKTNHLAIQMVYVVGYAALMRCRYYTAWTMANMHMIAADFRCSVHDFKTHVSAIEVYEFETTFSIKKRTAHWNVSIAKWLKTCFYIPLVKDFHLNAELAKLSTFIISAFWHGFHPTYYVVFFLFFIDSLTERLVNRNPLISQFFPKIYYMFIIDLTTILFNHLTIGNLIMVITNVSTLYILKITVLVTLILFSFAGKPINAKLSKTNKSDKKKVESS